MTICSLSPNLQHAPRPRQPRRWAAHTAGLPRRHREVVEGVRAPSEKYPPGAPCWRLFQSRRPFPPLQARICPFVRPRVADNTAYRARRVCRSRSRQSANPSTTRDLHIYCTHTSIM